MKINVTIIPPNITEEERQRRIKEIQEIFWGLVAQLPPEENKWESEYYGQLANRYPQESAR